MLTAKPEALSGRNESTGLMNALSFPKGCNGSYPIPLANIMYMYSVYHNKGFDWQVDYVTPTPLEARLFNYVHVHVCKSFACRILVRTLLQVLLAAAPTVATELCIPHCHWKSQEE